MVSFFKVYALRKGNLGAYSEQRDRVKFGQAEENDKGLLVTCIFLTEINYKGKFLLCLVYTELIFKYCYMHSARIKI